jgi:hypothetical protein
MKHLLLWVAFTAATGVLWVRAEDAPAVPTNFGIKDGSMPTDPRESRWGRKKKFPVWPVARELPDDTFTFARLRYKSKWRTDYPDSDMNFSLRLQQVTSLQVNPNGAIVDIDADQLRQFPFIYMIDPGRMSLTDAEAVILRAYMMNGGFIMADDFWGTQEWNVFYRALKQIFPDREPQDLPIEHEIFNMVFRLTVKPQIPSPGFAIKGRSKGMTHEWDKPGSEQVHYRAILDDQKRIMMMICHNTDLGDGWEEEARDPWYFQHFSEKYAYPLGINIVFYALTH